MRNFTKEELEFVKTCLENCVPKNQFVESVLHTDNRIFHKMCIRAGFEYPNFRKNKIWKNPFENVNSPEVQYWLGWLATDGYVSTNKGAKRCALSLQLRDVDVIEKFQKFLGGKLTIYKGVHHKKFPYARIAFRNEKIISFLEKLGFNNNKTFYFDPKFEISWDYIRGCFEGDGYLRWGNTNEFNICGGCLAHLIKLKDFIESHNIKVYINSESKNRKNPLYYIMINRKSDIIKVLDNIYQNADIFMNRKYLLARSISNNTWKPLKFGEPALGIPSEADNYQNV